MNSNAITAGSGLQMSALCVGAIVITWPAVSKLMPPDQEHKHSFWQIIRVRILLVLAVSLIIQLALLPLSLTRFQIAGFWFPFNLIWLPLLGLVVLPGGALALILSAVPLAESQILAGWLVDAASWPAGILLKILNLMRNHGLLSEPAFMIPHWSALLAFGALACALGWLWGNVPKKRIICKSRSMLCASLALLAIAPSLRIYAIITQKPLLEALDTGQSQAVLATLPGDIRILVDGGGSYYNRFDPGKMIVAPYLLQNKPPRLEAVFNTHPDMDHLGGLFHILEYFQVGALFHNGREANKSSQATWHQFLNAHCAKILQAGDEIIIGAPRDKIHMQVLHPPGASLKWRENGASLIMRLAQNEEGLAIFPGDAETENLRALLEQNRDLHAQVVFAPHHGSDKNLLKEFYLITKPEAVIACCGYLNRWHYPGRKLRKLLESNNIDLYDTGTHGRIGVLFGENGMIVSTTRQRKNYE